MKFYRELIESAGIAGQKQSVTAGLGISLATTFALVWLLTGIPALSVCVALLALAASLEVIRVIAASRASAFEKLWPQIFDSFQNAAQSSISLSEQLGYLAENGPVRLRHEFARLGFDLDRGEEMQIALANFRAAIGSRHADFLALLIELSNELGSNSMAKTWEQAANELRSEQAIFGQVLAKQGWVLGSAKMSLIGVCHRVRRIGFGARALPVSGCLFLCESIGEAHSSAEDLQCLESEFLNHCCRQDPCALR